MPIAISEAVAEIVSTSNATTYDFGSFTPTANSLLVCVAVVSATVAAGSMSTVSGTTLTWNQETTFDGGGDRFYLYWAKVGSSVSASVYRINVTGDAGTGCFGYMLTFTGYDSKRANPIRQFAANSGLGTANANVTFSDAMNTNNGYAALWSGGLSSSNPANVSTPPTSWTEIGDNGYGSPTRNASCAFRAGGETGTTITFTNATASWGCVGFEVYADTGPGAQIQVRQAIKRSNSF